MKLSPLLEIYFFLTWWWTRTLDILQEKLRKTGTHSRKWPLIANSMELKLRLSFYKIYIEKRINILANDHVNRFLTILSLAEKREKLKKNTIWWISFVFCSYKYMTVLYSKKIQTMTQSLPWLPCGEGYNWEYDEIDLIINSLSTTVSVILRGLSISTNSGEMRCGMLPAQLTSFNVRAQRGFASKLTQ